MTSLSRISEKALFFQKAFDSICGNGTLIDPVFNSILFHRHFCRVKQRIIGADHFNKFSVTWAFNVGNNNPVKKVFFLRRVWLI